MKKNKYFIMITSMFMLLPSITYASCSEEEINNFKKIEYEYKVTYEFDRITQKYNVIIFNPEPEKYNVSILYTPNSYCQINNDNELECSSVNPDKYEIIYYGITSECNEVLKTSDLDLSINNRFYNDPLCEGIEEFVLCQPRYDKEIDYDTFVSRVNTYKKTKELEEQTEEIEIDDINSNQLIEYIKNNILQIIIIGSFIILVIVTIILTTESIKKSRRLE